MYEINFWAILAAGVASMLVGAAWYHPKVLGGAWMRLNNMTPEMVERGKRRMARMTFVALLASMLVAYVMSYFGIAWGVYTVPNALELGFWCWMGFVAPAMLGSVLWDQKPLRLYFINSLYWLVSFLVMALVLFLASGMGGGYGSYPDASGVQIYAE